MGRQRYDCPARFGAARGQGRSVGTIRFRVGSMNAKFHFSYQSDWRSAPVAFWVHRTVDGTASFDPPAPPAIPHKGFAFLHVEFGAAELVFSAPAQLDHFIDVLSRKPLPTSRALSSQRGLPAGPNGHWLSRLPAGLKSPRTRMQLVEALRAIRSQVVSPGGATSFKISTTH